MDYRSNNNNITRPLPLYGPNTRFNINDVNERGSNQFKKETRHDIYKWLISRTDEVREPSGMVVCWCPISTEKGIELRPTGYVRINVAGAKQMAHVFVWEYHSSEEVPKEKEVSHLCSNPQCCRPSHLTVESRKDNIARRTCLGYIILPGDQTTGYRNCQHNPRCKRVTLLDINSRERLVPDP